eukprot:CAMPEP_0195104418 /NCGR_PEP_ID=MMETSP0448-20130528/73090_1 /TAXON_ID=66468 /ORGANISM="Heterocapsa triquestra, Strain CCMP 448" /LENGTH=71 /DNA_ID=CAMNT_0040140255 /DNA_START=67 /DNA_END=279 /DNA_ORIENTATION=+
MPAYVPPAMRNRGSESAAAPKADDRDEQPRQRADRGGYPAEREGSSRFEGLKDDAPPSSKGEGKSRGGGDR